jgi:hypothetical protein
MTKAVLFEALLGADEGGHRAPLQRSSFDSIVQRHGLNRLPLFAPIAPATYWPSAFYAADRFIAACTDNGYPDYVEVIFGAQEAGALDFLYDEVEDANEFFA